MPSTNRHLPSAPLFCVQASLCTPGQMLNKDHDTTTAATQLICIVLANYGNICKRLSQLRGGTLCSAIQNLGVIPLPGLFYLTWWDVFL